MVDKLPPMTDMCNEDGLPNYGLCICLCSEDLEKLNLDTGDVDLGDMLHLHCLATVTSISKNEIGERVELRITHIAAGEDEDAENRAEDKGLLDKLYSDED